MKTLYEYATDVMNLSIEKYLSVADKTKGFQVFTLEVLQEEDVREMLLAGKSLDVRFCSPKECLEDLVRVSAIKFDVEKGVSHYVYKHSRNYIQELIKEASIISKKFTVLTPEDIKLNPHLLPIWQAALKIGSKSNIKTIFGTATDKNISKPSSVKIADFANTFFGKNTISTDNITERVAVTLEGIVRDLVGRILLESVVENALDKAKVPYLTEKDYSGIDGVIYKFRADFVIPNESTPLAFIEVRKSSSRHASLYAKDKMFSAINWKGKHKEMLGIIVTEGEWTNETLITMSKVFDYVVPLSDSEILAEKIKNYLDGDKSILKWIVDFSISKNIVK
ncbi:MAG: hypothetical protein ABS938_01555 [Psychrobacillus psychrodurans]